MHKRMLFGRLKGEMFSEAQYNVGYMYENGDAGTIDRVEAKRWYQKAAANGNRRAKDKLK